MALKQKPPEILQAQVADFLASEHPVQSWGGLTIKATYDDLMNLAKKPIDVYTKRPIEDKTGQPVEKEIQNINGSTRNIWDEHVEYLRESGGSRNPAISGRADLLSAYKDFEIDPSRIDEDLNKLDDGSNSDVFTLASNGGSYVIRRPKSNEKVVVDEHMRGFIKAKGDSLFEQGVAASYDEGIIVSELVSGKALKHLGADEIGQATEEQINELLDAFVRAQRVGIHVDFNMGNFMYDPEKGFTIIDYTAANGSKRIPGLHEQNQDPQTMTKKFMAVLDKTFFSYGYESDNLEPAIQRETIRIKLFEKVKEAVGKNSAMKDDEKFRIYLSSEISDKYEGLRFLKAEQRRYIKPYIK